MSPNIQLIPLDDITIDDRLQMRVVAMTNTLMTSPKCLSSASNWRGRRQLSSMKNHVNGWPTASIGTTGA